MFSVSQDSGKIKINRKLFASHAKRKDLNKFQAVLDKCKIAYETDVSNAQFVATSGHNVPCKKNVMLQKIFENNSVEINFVTGSDVPFYFLIMPKNQARTDNKFFLLQVENFICNLRANGYAQQVVCQNFCDKIIKIIPLLSEGVKVDINQKIINAILCYFGEEALTAFDIFPVCNLRKAALTDQRFQSLHFSREAIWTHVKALACNVNKALFTYLIDNRVLLAFPENLKVLDKAMGIIPDELQKSTPSCAFCQENTIRNQLVLDCGKLLLILNFRPFAGTKVHFLILPKRHIEDWSDLREDERIILTLVVQSIIQSIQANCGEKETEIISYVQNGIQAGQTVPHSHMHVMTTPKYIPYLIDIYYQMVGMVAPALTSTKMAELSDLFKPVLFQALLFNAPPPRLLKDVAEVGTLMMFNAHKNRKDRIEDRRLSSETKVDYGSAYPVSRFRPHSFGNN